MWTVLVAAALALPPGAQPLADAALADAAHRHSPEASVVQVERVTWRDGSLGCPRKGVRYTQALVPGWRIVVAADGRQFDYHSNLRGPPFECPPGRARQPLPGPPT